MAKDVHSNKITWLWFSVSSSIPFTSLLFLLSFIQKLNTNLYIAHLIYNLDLSCLYSEKWEQSSSQVQFLLKSWLMNFQTWKWKKNSLTITFLQLFYILEEQESVLQALHWTHLSKWHDGSPLLWGVNLPLLIQASSFCAHHLSKSFWLHSMKDTAIFHSVWNW